MWLGNISEQSTGVIQTKPTEEPMVSEKRDVVRTAEVECVLLIEYWQCLLHNISDSALQLLDDDWMHGHVSGVVSQNKAKVSLTILL